MNVAESPFFSLSCKGMEAIEENFIHRWTQINTDKASIITPTLRIGTDAFIALHNKRVDSTISRLNHSLLSVFIRVHLWTYSAPQILNEKQHERS